MFEIDNSSSLEKWMEQYPDVRNEALKRLRTFHKREAKRLVADCQSDLFGASDEAFKLDD
jgi:hypothetical protein